MSDIILRQNILDELEFEPRVDAVNIGVTVDAGIVTLPGHVRNYAEKVAAENGAQRVNGVRGLAFHAQSSALAFLSAVAARGNIDSSLAASHGRPASSR